MEVQSVAARREPLLADNRYFFASFSKARRRGQSTRLDQHEIFPSQFERLSRLVGVSSELRHPVDRLTRSAESSSQIWLASLREVS